MSTLLQQQRKQAREGTYISKSQQERERQKELLLNRMKEKKQMMEERQRQQEILQERELRQGEQAVEESQPVKQEARSEAGQNESNNLFDESESVPNCFINDDVLQGQSVEEYLNSLQNRVQDRENSRRNSVQRYFEKSDSERSENDYRDERISRNQEMGSSKWVQNEFISNQKAQGEVERLNRYVKEKRLSQVACDLLMELVDEPSEPCYGKLPVLTKFKYQQWSFGFQYYKQLLVSTG
eukprot:TRINITY_DN7817_c0_g1_i5.p2 TRINITY_DN7817_c0_g1~~TRINITY_DN7817_c0_g1_i5.p2  ORF type:complete len:240 (-),score=29.10 TRINITY_DN7817_c0_g1_i5:410-1129(-)